MKTLIFCAGAANPDFSLLAQNKPALLVGVDAGAARLAAAGWMPDWAVGDFDSAPPPQACPNILRLPAAKNDTDLEAALLHLLPRYPLDEIEKIVILGALGAGRLDHLLCNVGLGVQPRFAAWREKFYFAEQGQSLRFLNAGNHRIRREAGKPYLSFIGLTPLADVHLQGVRYPLTGADYAYPPALISNEFLADEMTCRFRAGVLALIQSADVPK
ncbi:thiamine diphosphokinase [Conchiformibius steedae]|uniref:Thiamine diphosphokinase n=1 Tax=Conchiformibius steedae TaxID=153493 RepID=A0A3P2A1Y0_9NEIS|nr:thiamine diphosphokinase [Conchiformibius steedae]RRD89339.1 thiamine diphosphokinase [Conchiformibius steedae]